MVDSETPNKIWKHHRTHALLYQNMEDPTLSQLISRSILMNPHVQFPRYLPHTQTNHKERNKNTQPTNVRSPMGRSGLQTKIIRLGPQAKGIQGPGSTTCAAWLRRFLRACFAACEAFWGWAARRFWPTWCCLMLLLVWRMETMKRLEKSQGSLRSLEFASLLRTSCFTVTRGYRWPRPALVGSSHLIDDQCFKAAHATPETPHEQCLLMSQTPQSIYRRSSKWRLQKNGLVSI